MPFQEGRAVFLIKVLYMPESLTLNPYPGTYFLMLRLWSIKLITLQSVLHRGALKVIKDEACAGERAIGAWGRRILQGCSPGADKEAVQEWSSVYSLLGMDSSRFLNLFFFLCRAIPDERDHLQGESNGPQLCTLQCIFSCHWDIYHWDHSFQSHCRACMWLTGNQI